MIKSPINLLVFLLLAPSAFAETSVLFAPSPDVATRIEETLDGAKESIDLAIYGLSHPRLKAKVAEAAKRGVRVRVLLHNAQQESKTATALEAAGADVRYVSKTMHHKFCIADSNRVLTGSANWSRSAFDRYDEDLLTFDDDADVTRAFENEFGYIWTNAKDFGERRFVEYQREKYSCADIFFTSQNMVSVSYRGEPTFRRDTGLPGRCGYRIIRAIDKATERISIATTHFRRRDIYDALLEAINRGVQVQIVLDQQEANAQDSKRPDTLYDEALAFAGAVVRYKTYSTRWDYRSALQLHCKYMVVDECEVLTGSLNWSEASELDAFENLIHIKESMIAKTYVEHFDQVFNYDNSKLDDVLKSVAKNGHMRFKPVSLPWAQVRAIRFLAEAVDAD